LRQGSGIFPQGLFVFIAILGSVLIWITKSMGIDPMLTIIVPVLSILIYCGLAWKTNLFYLREDQIGDNAYYLGFLYTLASLAYALWRFQMDKGSDPADIIGSFGVALWSTILGISLRVFFAQMRQDPQDIEKDARAKLAHTASMLSSDLYQASLTFNDYTRGLQQSVNESFLHAKEISDKTVKSLETLNQKIEKVEAPDDLINRKIDGIFSNLESTTEKLNSLAGSQTQSIENLLRATNDFSESVKSINGHISNMKGTSTTINEGTQNFQKITDLVKELQKSLGLLSEGFSELNSKQAVALKGISQHADALGKQLERSRKYTEETHESLASMTKTLAEKLK